MLIIDKMGDKFGFNFISSLALKLFSTDVKTDVRELKRLSSIKTYVSKGWPFLLYSVWKLPSIGFKSSNYFVLRRPSFERLNDKLT